jgi:putative ABC transport system permease protein
MPDWRSEICRALEPLHLSPTREASVIAEVEQHLEQHYGDLLAQGMPEADARSTALAGLDNHDLLRELRNLPKDGITMHSRQAGAGFWDDLGLDIRFAFRMLGKKPSFAAVAILTLAIGFGANTAVFSLVNTVLLRPLYPDIQRLLVLQDVPLSARKQKLNMTYKMSYPIYLSWKEQKDIFDSVSAIAGQGPSLTGMGEPERLQAAFVSSDLLPTLGITPMLGRGFGSDDEPYSSSPVVLLTHSFWRSHFNSDRGVIGRKLTLNDQPFTIIGVLPESAQFSFLTGVPFDIVEPLREAPASAVLGFNHLFVIGKLRAGLSQVSALQAIQSRVFAINKHFGRDRDIQVIPLEFYLTSEAKPLVLVLFGAVAVVLLITCANTANLLLARGAARDKEMAIRIALGARRGRLVRQLLTESLLVSLFGGALGLLGMWMTQTWLSKLLADRLPPGVHVQVNASVLMFTLGLVVGVGTIFGVLPGLQGPGKALRERLNQGGKLSARPVSHRVRNVLVVGEIAFSLVLLAGAGLLLRSFVQLMNVDRGFDSDHVLTLRIWPSPTRYADPQKYIAYVNAILERTQALPGVKAAGWASCLPVSGSCITGDFEIEGRPSDSHNLIMGAKQLVGGDYFRAMHVRLLSGRFFNEHDKTDSAPVAIIDQAFAEQYFGHENPIGKHIDFGWGGSAWAEIVGVAGEVKESLADHASPTAYVPLAQRPAVVGQLAFSLAVRSAYEPSEAARSVRDAIHQTDSTQIIEAVQAMDEVVDQSVSSRRAPLWLFSGFSGIALFLAAIGIYGVLSFYVTQRREEIGTRMALGAQRGDILRLILGHAGKLIAAGLAGGLIITLAATRALQSLLFGTKPYDGPTLLAVCAVLAMVALLACSFPVFRATRVDPQVVLRNE